MNPTVKRCSDGLVIYFNDGEKGKALDWHEAAVLATALRHELEDHDREDGVALDAPADDRHENVEPT